MKLKKSSLLFIVGIVMLSSYGQYVTPGNGSSLTLSDLVNLSAGVVTGTNGHFIINNNLTIAPTDTLKIITNDTVLVSSAKLIEIQGVIICNPPVLTVFRAQDTTATFKGFKFSDSNGSLLQNTSIEFAGGNKLIGSNMTINNCRFYKNDFSQSSGALDIFQCNPTISNCIFDQNERSAIATAANAAASPKILNCYFYKNSTKNTNRPQINLGSSSPDTIIIRGNTIIGQYPIVGGISALLLTASEFNIVIDSNLIVNNRYGINIQGSGINYTITNNTIIDNNLETNPNNGGSGISFNGNNSGIVSNNLITGSLWGITILNGAQPNLGQIVPSVANVGQNHIYNNGNNGQTYNLYNNTAGTIKAQNNYWGTNNIDSVELGIFHYPDNNSLGLVDYLPIYQLSNENHMLSFKLTDGSNSATGTIDEQIINVQFNTLANIESLKAVFVVSEKATVWVNGELQISGVSIQNFSDTVIYTVIAENTETRQYYVKVTNYVQSSENQLLSFSLSDDNQTYEGTINGNIVDVKLNHDTDLSQLTATFTLSDKASAFINNVLQISGETVNDFSEWVTYVIRAENGEENEYIIKTDMDVGVNLTKVDINIMPNPTKENVIIQSNSKITNISLFDINGKLINVWKTESNKEIIEIKNIIKGIYLLKIETNIVTITEKLIIQ